MFPDVIYKYKATGDGDELRYSLRSLENLPHGNVHIIGDRPEWVNNVTHHPADDTGEGKHWQLMHKYGYVGRNAGLFTPKVYMMSDDVYIMRPQPEGIPPLFSQTLSARFAFIANYERRPESDYAKMFYNLALKLERSGYRTRNNFDLHVPQAIYPAVMPEWFDADGVLYAPASAFGNMPGFREKPRQVRADIKVRTPEDLSRWQVSNAGFLTSHEATWRENGVFDLLRDTFPDKSRYEQ